MKITKYGLELTNERHPVLVVEDSTTYPLDSVCNTEHVVHMINDLCHLNRTAEEYVFIIAIDAEGHVLGVFEVSHGTVDTALIRSREIFIRACLCGAQRIIMVHNHPSGDPTPSEEDIQITKKIKEAGDLMGIVLVDSIVIGSETYQRIKVEEI